METLITRIILTGLLLGGLYFVWTTPVSITAWYRKILPSEQQKSNIMPSQDDLEHQKRESDPKVKVSLKQTLGELQINIRAEKNVATLALDIPIVGKVINIHDNNSIADVITKSKRIVGENTDTSSNNVEIMAEDIKPLRELSYKILFKPLPKDTFVAGTDRYQISHTWQFAGNTFSKTQWISFKTGEPVEKPSMQIKGLSFTKRALSPEEIKKLYENGLKKRTIE